MVPVGNGGRPVSRKYSVHPRLYKSARMSLVCESRACSGAMNSGVPITEPTCVKCAEASPVYESSQRASPRSRIFTTPQG